MPRTTSSWSLVSSRQTAAGRSGASAASARSESGSRRGDSKATTVSVDWSTRSSSPARRGRKPSNRHRSAGSPEATSAVVIAVGPGQHLDLDAALDAGLDQPVAGIGEDRGAGVAEQGDPGAALDRLGELRRPALLVGVVVGDEARASSMSSRS